MTKSTGKNRDRPQKEKKVRRLRAPGRSIEARENQLISMSYDLVEKKIKRGTATAQEVIYFLKTGSVLAQLEKEKVENENVLLKAKTESLRSQKRVEELYAEAMRAYRKYNGEDTGDEDESE